MSCAFENLQIGDAARVLGYKDMPSGYRKKLMSLGLTPGTAFTIKRSAPLGDPIELEFRGFSLSLRKQEANGLEIEKILVQN